VVVTGLLTDVERTMPIRITLSDNEIIEVGISLDEWNRAYQEALQGNTMLEIQEPSGRILSINPRRVVYLEAMEPDQADQQVAEDQQTQVA
jgi:hypothetical protein